jgi:hypothetical protein
MQSVPITTNIVSSNPVHGEVYSIQHYVIKFVSDTWTGRWLFVTYSPWHVKYSQFFICILYFVCLWIFSSAYYYKILVFFFWHVNLFMVSRRQPFYMTTVYLTWQICLGSFIFSPIILIKWFSCRASICYKYTKTFVNQILD